MTPKKNFYATSAKPTVPAPDFAGIPAGLRAADRWVAWRLIARWNDDGTISWTKVPFQPNGVEAKSNDPTTWTTYEAATAAYAAGGFDGIGFVFGDGDGNVGVDLDDAIDPATQQLHPWAAAIVASLDTYCEVSPSGTGVKLFGRGAWAGARKKWKTEAGGDIEVYVSGRYFAATGLRYGDTGSVNDVQAGLDLLATTCPAGGTKKPAPAAGADTGGGGAADPAADERLLAKAKAAKNGEKFAQLWDGKWADHHNSQSEADLALCGMLAFWTSKDADRMDRLFRRSELMRPKWDTARDDSTYGRRTIDLAIAGCEDVYAGADLWGTAGGDSGDRPPEAPDDPHRLGREFSQSLAPAGEPPRLRHWLDGWWLWENGAYRPMSDGDLRAKLHNWVRAEFERECQLEAAEGAAGPQRPVRKVTAKLIGDVLGALKAIANVPGTVALPAWLDGAAGPAPADLIAFPNGILDVGTGTLLPATASLFTPSVAGCAYDPAAPAPAAFERFLGEVLPDEDAVAAAWEWLGLLLSSETKYHKFLYLIGPRRAGKSTFVKVLEALAGPGNVAAMSLNALSEPFGLSPLLGKSVATISEARITARADSVAAVSRLLAITGEDEVSVNRKNRDIVSARLRTRFVMVGNELPELPDDAGALACRMVVLHFHKSFEGLEDRDLAGRLLAELPGIARKAVEALGRVRARGHLLQPASGDEHKEEFVAAASPVRQFVADRCTLGDGWSATAASLYIHYQEWCQQQGVDGPGTAAAFGRKLRTAFPTVMSLKYGRAGARATNYRGIGLTALGPRPGTVPEPVPPAAE